jgi:HEAT repeat protein
MLARVLQEADPFGDDLPLVLETIDALSSLRDDRALAAIAAIAKQKRWLAWGKTRQLRVAALRALAAIGTPKAKQTLADLARSGDFFLRRLAAKAGRA